MAGLESKLNQSNAKAGRNTSKSGDDDVNRKSKMPVIILTRWPTLFWERKLYFIIMLLA